MGLNNLGLGIIVTAQDFASGSLRRINAGLNRLQLSSKLSGLEMFKGFFKGKQSLRGFLRVAIKSRSPLKALRGSFRDIGKASDASKGLMKGLIKFIGKIPVVALVAVAALAALAIGIIGLLVIRKATKRFA